MTSNYFGFSENPFELTPDSKFLFLTPGFKEALHAVLQGLQERRGLIVLIGEVGTGKTLLLHEIIRRLPATTPSALLFHSTFSYWELLRAILREFGEEGWEEEKENPETLLELFLHGLREKKKAAVVCIDEAHKLNPSVGRNLFSLLEKENGIPSVLQWVLCGQPELEAAFQAPGGKSGLGRPPLRMCLRPFSREESLAYIEHRLRIVGGSAAGLFTPEALDLIIAQAGGIPRRINTLCDNALFRGEKRLLKRIDLPTVKEVLEHLEGPDYRPPKTGPGPSLSRPRATPLRNASRKGVWSVFVLTCLLGILFVWPDFRLPVFSILTSKWSKPAPLISHSLDKEPFSGTKSNLPFPAPPTGPQTLSGRQKIVVQKGQNLSGLIYSVYGKYSLTLADWVLMHNPSIKDVDLILVDQELHLPEWNREALVFPDPSGGYRIFWGTYATAEEAEIQKKRSTPPVFLPVIVPKRLPSGKVWYRVVSGPYSTREKALEALGRLKTPPSPAGL